MPTFTPAQQDFYDTLKQVDRQLVEIAREILQAWRPDVETRPEAFGAPVNTHDWVTLEHASQKLRAAVGDDQNAASMALVACRAVLAEGRQS